MLILAGYTIYQEYYKKSFNLGTARSGVTVLAGTPSKFDRVPVEFVDDSSTTTDPAIDGGGNVFYQQIYTKEGEYVHLSIQAVAGTSSSTLAIWPFVSNDGLTFYRPAFATSSDFMAGTTTLNTTYSAYEWDPSMVTSTQDIYFPVRGATYMRFEMYGEDESTDPEDFVKAYIQAAIEPSKSINASL